MDSKHVIGLYEAYRSVYEDREYLNEDVDYDLYEAKGEGPEAATPGTQLFQQLFRGNKKRRGSKEAPMDTSRFQGKGSKAKRRMHNEEVDLYDVVLDHLLDEGYCDDVDSAEIIMANMSEEWLDDILDEAVIGAKKGTIRSVIEKGGKSIKYVQSGGDIVAGDRSADLRTGAAEGKRYLTNAKNQRRVELANNRSIKRLNADPKHGYKDITIDGYGSVPTDYRARRRRASGR